MSFYSLFRASGNSSCCALFWIMFYVFGSLPVHSAPAQSESTNPEAETSICTGNAEKGARRHTADTTYTECIQKISVPSEYRRYYLGSIREKEYYESRYQENVTDRHKNYEWFKFPEEWQKKLGESYLIQGVVETLMNPVQKGVTPDDYGEFYHDFGLVIRKEAADSLGLYTVLFSFFTEYVKGKGPQKRIQEINRAVLLEIAKMGKKCSVILSIVDSTSVVVEAAAPGKKESEIESVVKRYTFLRSDKGNWPLENVTELVIRKVREGVLSIDSLHYSVNPADRIGLFGNDDKVMKSLRSKETYTMLETRYLTIDDHPKNMTELGPGDSLVFSVPLASDTDRIRKHILIIDKDVHSENPVRELLLLTQNESGNWDVEFQTELMFRGRLGEPIRYFTISKDWFAIREWPNNTAYCDHYFCYNPQKRSWRLSKEMRLEERFLYEEHPNYLPLYTYTITYGN